MVFYVLDIATSGSSRYATFTVKNRPVFEIKPPRCKFCSVEIGRRKWLPPYNVDVENRSIGDLISDGTNFILSEHACKVFEEGSVTGVKYSAEFVNLGKKNTKNYRVVFPKNVLTRIDEKESGVKIEELVGCDKCRVMQREKIDRLRIDESTWNGEDIFFPSGLFGVIVATKRLVDIVKLRNLTNFTFIHQDDYYEDWTV